jgi:DNA repair exonuclease SbcCD nuclease subunit
MPRIRLVHAADLHLDTPFEGIAGPAPQVAEALREASLQAWDDLVRFTIAQDAAALLLAGDLYDGAQRGVRAQIRVQSGLRALSEAGVQTFIVHGNHDPLDGWSAIREWPTGVHVFGHEGVEVLPLEHHGSAVAHVHGISYGRRDVAENLAARFRRGSAPGAHIGLLHANAGGSREHAAYAPCSLSDLQAAGMDYWALGHIHQRQILRGGDPWIVYPGDLQGRSPKASETGAKGVYLVEFETDPVAVLAPVFHPLDRIRFAACRHDVAGYADLPALHSGLLDALEALRDEHAGRGVLARVVLEGRGDVVTDLRHPGALLQLRAELRQRFDGAAPLLWVESLVDHAASPLDLDAIRARGEFSAEVLARADGLVAASEGLSDFVRARSAQLCSGQVGRQVSALPTDPDAEILSEALALVLDRLEAAEDA